MQKTKAGLHPFGPLVSDVWTDIHRIKHNKYRDEHPCQLPIHLLERIILMSTDEGDIALDPFVGTGTTVIAAKRLGRKFIGIDIDENYVNITKDKLSKESSNSKIGGQAGIWNLGLREGCEVGEFVGPKYNGVHNPPRFTSITEKNGKNPQKIFLTFCFSSFNVIFL